MYTNTNNTITFKIASNIYQTSNKQTNNVRAKKISEKLFDAFYNNTSMLCSVSSSSIEFEEYISDDTEISMENI